MQSDPGPRKSLRTHKFSVPSSIPCCYVGTGVTTQDLLSRPAVPPLGSGTSGIEVGSVSSFPPSLPRPPPPPCWAPRRVASSWLRCLWLLKSEHADPHLSLRPVGGAERTVHALQEPWDPWGCRPRALFPLPPASGPHSTSPRVGLSPVADTGLGPLPVTTPCSLGGKIVLIPRS
jgi:hypothetical protein